MPTSKTKKLSVLKLATRPDIIKQSLIVTVIVGTILNLINQGDAVSDMDKFELGKCLLTYMVPYCVSTYGAVSALMSSQSDTSG